MYLSVVISIFRGGALLCTLVVVRQHLLLRLKLILVIHHLYQVFDVLIDHHTFGVLAPCRIQITCVPIDSGAVLTVPLVFLRHPILCLGGIAAFKFVNFLDLVRLHRKHV